jgi:hypothetical protein
MFHPQTDFLSMRPILLKTETFVSSQEDNHERQKLPNNSQASSTNSATAPATDEEATLHI